jgi:glutathione peroxidase
MHRFAWLVHANVARRSYRFAAAVHVLHWRKPLDSEVRRMPDIYDFEANLLDGTPQKLDAYRGKLLLIVNVASKCGFTPQYEGLEALYRANKDKGLEILGFPCNQFGHQEPGDADAIRNFCSTKYGVTFPLFAKIDVNGANAHPLYKFLKHAAPGVLGSEAIKWNFTKFLIDREGNVVRRYASADAPEKIGKDLAAML